MVYNYDVINHFCVDVMSALNHFIPVLLIGAALALTMPQSRALTTDPGVGAPRNLTATAIGATQIDLAWEPPTASGNIVQYAIYRTAYNNCTSSPDYACAAWYSSTMLLATRPGTPPETSYSYSDTGLAPSTQYDYTVKACDALGNCSSQNSMASSMTSSLNAANVLPAAGVSLSESVTLPGGTFGNTLGANVSLPENVGGLTGSVFVAVLPRSASGGGAYFMSADGAWTSVTDCGNTPAARSGSLSHLLQLTLVSTPTNLSPLWGAAVYVGYGLGATEATACTSMLNEQTFKHAYTFK